MIKVTYVDHMGSDLSVVNAARVSFGKNSKPLNHESLGDDPTMIPFLPETDTKLINYLARHHHKSPFNHAFATFHVKAPIFVARQLQKHEYMPWNEISRRYVDSEPEFYIPDNWREKSDDKKQGSGEGFVNTLLQDDTEDYPDDKSYLADYWDVDTTGYVENNAYFHAMCTYKDLLKADVAPEQARMVLPQSTMTEWYWSGSLYAFSKMCGLRLKPDTQYETRLVAEQIGDKMNELFPESWIALRAYA